MISKELLSEVLRLDICTITIKDSILEYDCDFDDIVDTREINIYELAHKCKEWAFDKGFAFKIEYLGKKDINIQLVNCHNEKIQYSKDFYNIENIEHIYIPCEWILNNKNNL